MDYPFKVPGHPELNFSLRNGMIFSTILKDGVPLEQVDGAVNVPLTDGSSIELKIKLGWDLSLPKVQFGRRIIEVMPPLPALWLIWAYLAFLLGLNGGVIGGGCGGAAAAGTLWALRSDLPRAIRVMIAILVPPIGFLAYWIVAPLVLN